MIKRQKPIISRRREIVNSKIHKLFEIAINDTDIQYIHALTKLDKILLRYSCLVIISAYITFAKSFESELTLEDRQDASYDTAADFIFDGNEALDEHFSEDVAYGLGQY